MILSLLTAIHICAFDTKISSSLDFENSQELQFFSKLVLFLKNYDCALFLNELLTSNCDF